MQSQYNMRSPAVKRLMKEAQELRDPTEQYHVQPLDDNLFEWHFTIRGPADSDFEGGIYHGRIILPPDYPMKPPSIILLTPNGRFEVFKKICLSISGHHPESWQPSWSIRTALLAIIGFMPTHGAGAIGSLDYTPEERKILAKKSQEWKCPNCGPLEKMLLPVTQASEKTTQEAKELASQINFQGEKSKTSESSSTSTRESPDKENQEIIPSTSAPSTPSSTPSTPSAQSQTHFPWNQFMGAVPPNPFNPPPFPMPFMQPGNSNTMVPRFPLPCYAPMVPPNFFPPGFTYPNAGPWFPQQQPTPPTSMHSNQSGSNTVTSPAPSSAINQSQSKGVQSDSTSTKPNIPTDTPPSTTSITSNSRNQTETQNTTSASSSSPQPSQPSTNSSDTASNSGLRQRTAPANTRQAAATFQSAELTPPARSGGMASLALIIVLSCAIGLLLFRKFYQSFDWNILFR